MQNSNHTQKYWCGHVHSVPSTFDQQIQDKFPHSWQSFREKHTRQCPNAIAYFGEIVIKLHCLAYRVTHLVDSTTPRMELSYLAITQFEAKLFLLFHWRNKQALVTFNKDNLVSLTVRFPYKANCNHWNLWQTRRVNAQRARDEHWRLVPGEWGDTSYEAHLFQPKCKQPMTLAKSPSCLHHL